MSKYQDWDFASLKLIIGLILLKKFLKRNIASTDLNISKSSLSDEVKLVQSRKRMSASDDSADADVDGQVEGAKVALADVDGQGLLGGLQLGLGHGC